MKIGFLGAGKMATAIAGGLVTRQILAASDLEAVDVAPAAQQAFSSATGAVCGTDAVAMLERVDVLILAIKPQHAAEAVIPLRPFCSGKLVVSILAGKKLATLSEWIGHSRVVRVMPNTPAMVGCGAAVFSCGSGVLPEERRLVADIFQAVGLAMEMAEEQQDAVTALSGSGPAYVFELVRAMVEGAHGIGLDKEAALALTVQTVAGAAEMLRRNIGTPEELRRAVTSPGGTTAAGLAVLEKAGFPELIANVLKAACDRSRELGC